MMVGRKLLLAALVGAVSLVSAGCAPQNFSVRKEPTYDQAAAHPFVRVNYRAADALVAQLQGKAIQTYPLIVATLVNIDALDRSSTLGRLVSEHVSARMAQAGYPVVEMKLRNNVYMARGQGELMLTREIRDIATSHEAQAVVVGTYGESNDFLFVNLKVVRPQDSVTLAVHDYVLPMDRDVRAMVRTTR